MEQLLDKKIILVHMEKSENHYYKIILNGHMYKVKEFLYMYDNNFVGVSRDIKVWLVYCI